MTKYTVKLKDIRKNEPCEDRWKKLLEHLGVSPSDAKTDETPISLMTILDSNGFDDCIWCFCALDEKHENSVRLLVCDFAERSMKYVSEDEKRPQLAIDTARKYANGQATKEELDAAWDSASDAALAAAWAAAWDSARDAASDAEISWQEKELRKWLGE